MISSKYKYNTRHKIAIGVGIATMLLLNILPYKVYTDPKVEVPHRECIELPVDVECTENGQLQVYEVSSQANYIVRNDEVSSCAEYREVPRQVSSWNVFWQIITGVYVLAEIIGICVYICILIIKLVKWANSDNE